MGTDLPLARLVPGLWAVALLLIFLAAVGAIGWFVSVRTRKLAKFAIVVVLASLGLLAAFAVVRFLFFPFPPV